MKVLDLNADLGEGEAPARTSALLRCVQSANVACGGHAGSPASMGRVLREARRLRVRIGAHPGLWSRGPSFGREATPLTAGELSLLLLHQVGALQHLARNEGAPLHHVKLHGALYHMTETDPRLAGAYVDAIRRWWPRMKVYALAGGRVARLARTRGVVVWEEAFLDRAYEPDGRLVSRNRDGAVLSRIDDVSQRLRRLRRDGVIEAVDGSLLNLKPKTLCIHSDTPGSVRLARRVAEMLRGQGR